MAAPRLQERDRVPDTCTRYTSTGTWPERVVAWLIKLLISLHNSQLLPTFLADAQAPMISSMSKVATKVLDAQAFRGVSASPRSGNGASRMPSLHASPDHSASCSSGQHTATLLQPSCTTTSMPLEGVQTCHLYQSHLPAHSRYQVATPFLPFSLSSTPRFQQNLSQGSLLSQGSSLQHSRSYAELSRVRVAKRFGFNDTVMGNNTDLKTLRRKIKKSARLWIRIAATVPVTKKSEGVRMGKGKGAISFYCTPVRPGQILFEMDRLPKAVAVAAMNSIQAKFPVRLGFVEWS
eukprot:gene10404-8352_t